MKDGRVLVVGGENADRVLASAELYSADGSFQPAAPMANARKFAACVPLADGRVLLAGGNTGTDASLSAEIYDPKVNVWKPSFNSPLPRWGQTGSLLPDGRVLLAGGENAAGVTTAIEIFNPFTATFTILGVC